MRIRVGGMAVLMLAGLLCGGHALAAQPGAPPLCAEASHSVLKIQPGRDVCAPTVLPNGQAVSVGFMPTTCPPAFPELVVDAAGPRDLCRLRVAVLRFDRPARG